VWRDRQIIPAMTALAALLRPSPDQQQIKIDVARSRWGAAKGLTDLPLRG